MKPTFTVHTATADDGTPGVDARLMDGPLEAHHGPVEVGNQGREVDSLRHPSYLLPGYPFFQA